MNGTDFRSFTKFMDEEKIPYHTFTLPEEKNTRVVLRGIPVQAPLSQTKDVWQIKTVCSLMVKVEKPKKSGKAAQCHRCHRFFHAQRNCTAEHRCGEAHDTKVCTKESKEPPKCANCSAPHTANSPSFRKPPPPGQPPPSMSPPPRQQPPKRPPLPSQQPPLRQTPPPPKAKEAPKRPVAFWNANGLLAARDELEEFVDRLQLDIGGQRDRSRRRNGNFCK
ncbi:Nucleic-acid-binding protein from transposon X-element-like Protein [Tribolium castaneum]|uniref:Nucleic-acid-binding protein from transposon X-element-like Protein n=1 Tax=Tribolium castaneum TaxID=7070 RepID=A0A139W9B9_TRICA|nr:Nucleic-acid-binding protein from transposon X-element-like Protein [Tribolium castaneum]